MKKIFKLVAGFSLFSLTTVWAAPSASPTPIVNCWDRTFAYTTAEVIADTQNQGLLDVTLKSEHQLFAHGLVRGKIASWGNAKVSFLIGSNDCKSSPQRPDIISCDTRDGILYVDYNEDAQNAHSESLPIKTLHLETSLVDKTTIDGTKSVLAVDLIYDRLAEDEGSLHLEFPLDANKQCSKLQ